MIHLRHLPFGERVLFGGWTSLEHPAFTEMFAATGMDFIGVCFEHGTMSQADAQRLIVAAQAGGAACLPRVASHNGEQIRRVLDSGADGIIVPSVSRRSEVEQIVEWVKYPPLGKRGYGMARSQGYGFDFDLNCRTWNERSSILIQIESIQGVEAAGELLANEQINGAMIGPYDLSGSLGMPGQLEHPRVKEACAHVIDVCKRLRKGCGTHLVDPTDANVAAALEEGFNFTVLGSDVFLLWKWGERIRTIIQGARQGVTPGASRRVS